MSDSYNVPIAERISNNESVQKARESIMGLSESIGNSFGDIKENVSGVVSEYSSQDIAESGSSFLQSNSIIAKFVFLILVLIGFFILLNLGIYVVSWFTQPSKSPYVFKGVYPMNKKISISQNPKAPGSVPIYRSNNENKGIEFTWSTWLKVTDVNSLPVDANGNLTLPDTVTEINDGFHIFSKGSMPEGNVVDVNGPGLYAFTDGDGGLSLNIKMDISSSAEVEPIPIKNLPVNKWFHLAIRLQNKIMDIYVNGTITTRVPFANVPKQNFGDIFIGYGGVAGNISNLRYFDQALNVFQITNIVMSGPDLRNPDESDHVGKPDYLSSRWYGGQE
jgi:hypothetical protein